jgi:predicted MPP superfamily phosphohydrolase
MSICGVTCRHLVADDAARMGETVAQSSEEALRLLLFHSPDIAQDASEAGVDLYLCGHTHGGQVRLPFYGALITSSALGKKYEMGRYEIGPMTLYVSRGIGVEGASAPRARFLCSPEVILWSLVGR